MKGKAFETFIEQLERLLNTSSCTTVERNVHLPTKNGSVRQIDVLLTHKTDRHTFKTIIECKDWKRKADVKVIDEFVTKIKSVGADKGIIVSKSGFTTGLIREAKAHEFISLYTIQEVDSVAKEILDFNRLGYYVVTHRSNDWTVRFREKQEINKEMVLYTKLKLNETSKEFDITEVAQEFLTNKQQYIVSKVLDAAETEGSSINAELTLDINLPHPAYYDIGGKRTYVTGFKSIIKTTLTVNPVDIDKVFKYHDVSRNETVALLLNVDLNEETRTLVFSSSPRF